MTSVEDARTGNVAAVVNVLGLLELRGIQKWIISLWLDAKWKCVGVRGAQTLPFWRHISREDS